MKPLPSHTRLHLYLSRHGGNGLVVIMLALTTATVAFSAVNRQLVPFFSQAAPGMREVHLGNCAVETIASDGCFVTSKAMLFNYYNPGFTNPVLLNNCLTTAGKLAGCGLMHFESDFGMQAYCGPPGVTYAGSISNQGQIESAVITAIKDGFPVLLKVTSQQIKSHMVLAVGIDGSDIVINDPLLNTVKGRNITLRSRGYTMVRANFYRGRVPDSETPSLTVNAQSRERSDPTSDLVIEIREPGTRNIVKSFRSHLNASGSTGPILLQDVAPNMYDIVFRSPHRLSSLRNLKLSPGSQTVDLGAIFGADVNGDDEVNSLDIALIYRHFGVWDNPDSDVNGDGETNQIDRSLAIKRLGMSGDASPRSKLPQSVMKVESASAGPRLWIEMDSNYQVGSRIVAAIWFDAADRTLDAIDLQLRFDPGVMQFVTAVQSDATNSMITQSSRAARGELDLTIYSPTGKTFGGSAELCRVELQAIGSIERTDLTLTLIPGSTVDSNLAEAGSGVDVASRASGASVRVLGSPSRRLPSVRFIQPQESSALDPRYGTVDIAVEVDDTFNRVEFVRFEAKYSGTWHDLGTDVDADDGWAIVWRPTFYNPWSGSGVDLIGPIDIRATASIGSGVVNSAVITNVHMDDDFDRIFYGCVDLTVGTGASVLTIVTRHGGTSDDIEEVNRLRGRYHITVPWVDTAAGTRAVIREYVADSEVDSASDCPIFTEFPSRSIDHGRGPGAITPRLESDSNSEIPRPDFDWRRISYIAE